MLKLKDSRASIKAAIELQIKVGQQKFLSGEVENSKNFFDGFEALKSEFQGWTNHNVTLLRAKFDDEELIKEYKPRISLASSSLVYDPQDIMDEYEDFKRGVAQKISTLMSIIGKLDLFEERPHFGTSSGKLDSMHPKIIEVSGASLKNGNLRAAVMDAFIALDKYVQAKSGNSKAIGANLMQSVFSPSSPILKLSENNEEQMGFMYLFTGSVKAIRNQYAHNVVSPSSEQEAMEWRGFASALFRLVDQSEKI